MYEYYTEVEEAENQIALYKIGKFIKFEKEQKEYDVIDDYIYNRGNNAPFDFIFPHDREIIEEQMRQEECHIDNKKE